MYHEFPFIWDDGMGLEMRGDEILALNTRDGRIWQAMDTAGLLWLAFKSKIYSREVDSSYCYFKHTGEIEEKGRASCRRFCSYHRNACLQRPPFRSQNTYAEPLVTAGPHQQSAWAQLRIGGNVSHPLSTEFASHPRSVARITAPLYK
jgi:hypothetical protein